MPKGSKTVNFGRLAVASYPFLVAEAKHAPIQSAIAGDFASLAPRFLTIMKDPEIHKAVAASIIANIAITVAKGFVSSPGIKLGRYRVRAF